MIRIVVSIATRLTNTGASIGAIFRPYVFACLAMTVLSFNSISSAQTDRTTTNPSSNQAPSQAQKALITALDLLDQVAIVQAGVGFKSIQLGERFAKLERLWGKPITSRKTGLLRNKLQWRYQLDSNTIIEFVGEKTIVDIHIYANRLSLIRTLTGLSFDASQSEIERRYGKTKKAGTSTNFKLSYPALGISFKLDKSKVSGRGSVIKQIDIFAAKKK